MIFDDKVKDEKRQYDIKRKAEKISALSSGKIDKYEYLKGSNIATWWNYINRISKIYIFSSW